MIRVLRVLEYEYPTFADYEADRLRWTNHSPSHKVGFVMESEVVRVTVVGGEPDDPDVPQAVSDD